MSGTNTNKMSDEYPKVIMEGSYMDGLDIDLVEWCGLPPLTDEERTFFLSY